MSSTVSVMAGFWPEALLSKGSGSALKARGAFYTPAALARYMASWAIQTADDRVLEPSCGESAFLEASQGRFEELGPGGGSILGVELDPETASTAATLGKQAKVPTEVWQADFFDIEAVREFDVLIGNPPYIRYQAFSGASRAKGLRAALRQGVRLSGLSSSWAPFVVHAAGFLRPGGRLAMVVPAELLSVNYAAPVRRFLMERFGSVRIVLFEERVFPGVLEEVVLVLCDGEGPTAHCRIEQASNIEDLKNSRSHTWEPGDSQRKWTMGIISEAARVATRTVAGQGDTIPLHEWGKTDLGMVTGNNAFFCLSEGEANSLGLSRADVVRLSPPGSSHLRGLSFSESAWTELAERDRRVYLFRPAGVPGDPAQRYISRGEAAGVNRGYKCRTRTPWWIVPGLFTPDLFLTYMNHETPQLAANVAGVACLNSVHGVTVRKPLRRLASEILPMAALNTFTLLSAELVGRSYGGGLLKLEPREADQLQLPSPRLLELARPRLEAIKPVVSQALRSGRLLVATQAVDEAILSAMSPDVHDLWPELRSAREHLFARRRARGGGSHGRG